MNERIPWFINTITNFKVLVISIKVGHRDFVHDWDYDEDQGHDLYATDGEYNGETDNHLAKLIHYIIGSFKDLAIKYGQISCKDLHDLANGSDIKECIDRS